MLAYKNGFMELYNDFKLTEYWQKMLGTVEGSKWHREENVAVHTEMVLDQFFNRITNDYNKDMAGYYVWDISTFCCAVALLFHDTGKPAAKTKKYSEERGEYYGFGGHELISARIFETWAMENWSKYFADFIGSQNIYDIVWLIQNHLPYNIVKEHKLAEMRTTLHHIFGDRNSLFRTMVLSDQYGRISDNHDINKLAIHDWFDLKLKCIRPEHVPTPSPKTMYMLVGAPGTGKSTYTKSLTDFDPSINTYNLDSLRLQWYPCDDSSDIVKYKHAFNESTTDSTFNDRSKQHLISLLETNKSIIVDNTNTSDKTRNKIMTLGKQYGYTTVVILFPISINTLIERNNNRIDHQVPEDVIRTMYHRLTYPSLGGLVDRVKVIKQ